MLVLGAAWAWARKEQNHSRLDQDLRIARRLGLYGYCKAWVSNEEEKTTCVEELQISRGNKRMFSG